MVNPVGSKIRVDAGGSGHYGAPRSKINSLGRTIRYRHDGTDYACKPGQDVKAPMTGIIVRRARPYANKNYDGVVIEAKRLAVKMFYVALDEALIGRIVKVGDVIGQAQDISKKYPLVTPHIHVQIVKCDPEIFLGPTDIM